MADCYCSSPDVVNTRRRNRGVSAARLCNKTMLRLLKFAIGKKRVFYTGNNMAKFPSRHRLERLVRRYLYLRSM